MEVREDVRGGAKGKEGGKAGNRAEVLVGEEEEGRVFVVVGIGAVKEEVTKVEEEGEEGGEEPEGEGWG